MQLNGSLRLWAHSLPILGSLSKTLILTASSLILCLFDFGSSQNGKWNKDVSIFIKKKEERVDT